MPSTGVPSEWEDVPEPINTPAGGAPTVSGRTRLGKTLTADLSGIEDGNGLERVKFSYQWIRNHGSTDTDIEGATNAAYTLVADDGNKTLKVRVSFTDRGGYQESLTSEATGVNSPATGAPIIRGTLSVGETLTADTSSVADANGLDNATLSYQWISSDGDTDSDIEGATGSTYTLVTEDQGTTISVRATFTDDRGHPETLTSHRTARVKEACPRGEHAPTTPYYSSTDIHAACTGGEYALTPEPVEVEAVPIMVESTTDQRTGQHFLDAAVGYEEGVLHCSADTLTPIEASGNTNDSREDRDASFMRVWPADDFEGPDIYTTQAQQQAAATGIPRYPCYRTVEETFAAAESIVANNPTLARWVDVGDSWLKTEGRPGYDMMVLVLTNANVSAQSQRCSSLRRCTAENSQRRS